MRESVEANAHNGVEKFLTFRFCAGLLRSTNGENIRRIEAVEGLRSVSTGAERRDSFVPLGIGPLLHRSNVRGGGLVILKWRKAMNGRSKFALILTSLVMTTLQGATAGVPNAKLWNGTWHLNAAKSKFVSSAKRQSETRTYKISGNNVMMTSNSTDASGKILRVSYSARYDGKWYPMAGNPNADRISLKPVGVREMKWSSQLRGKPSVEGTAAVSADGKHLTITRKFLRMKGAPTDVLEFDR